MIAVWIVVVLASFPALGLFLGDVLTSDVEVTAETESRRADRLLERAFPETRAEQERELTEAVVLRSESGDPPAAERVAALAGELEQAGAAAVEVAPEGEALVSRDGDARVLFVGLGLEGEDDVESVYDVIETFDADPAYEVTITGELTSEADHEELSGEDLRTGELFFGMPAVLVFQEGVGAGLLGLTESENVAAWVPLFLFSVLFGLSMDYQVFLLSRIRERYEQTGDSDEAVEWGVASTARLITGAALIVVAVFWGFAMGDLIMFQQMGFGVAVALLIDATIVRGVLVPAAMKLLGSWNWYLPGWLSWLPNAHMEGGVRSRRA